MNPPHLTELDPETASLLLMGDTARRDENYEVAVACYERAIKRRAGHPGGLFNLAVCRMYLDRLAPALEALEALEERLASEDDDAGWSELRLSACYNAVLVHWYLAEERPADHAAQLREAVRKCRSMALAIAAGLRHSPITTERRGFLDGLAGATIALLSALLVEAFAHGVGPPADPRADAQAQALRSAGPAHDGQLRQKLKTIRSSAPKDDPEWVAAVSSDTWHQPRAALAIARVARERYGHDPRTRYNLAVMQARVLRRMPDTPATDNAVWQALEDLEYALENEPFRARWAKRDNLLAPLRTAEPDAFMELFEPGAHPV